MGICSTGDLLLTFPLQWGTSLGSETIMAGPVASLPSPFMPQRVPVTSLLNSSVLFRCSVWHVIICLLFWSSSVEEARAGYLYQPPWSPLTLPKRSKISKTNISPLGSNLFPLCVSPPSLSPFDLKTFSRLIHQIYTVLLCCRRNPCGLQCPGSEHLRLEWNCF